MRTILFTGFPGFIGKRLVAAILDGDPKAAFVFLVQAKFRAQAEAALAELRRRPGGAAANLGIELGDITDPKLGLAEARYLALAGQVTEVWHLAAIYDLSVGEAVAQRVNVDGTRHVLDFCAATGGRSRLLHFSTCYVAGDRTGLIREDELVMGQGFKNYYESTKFAAEVLVRLAQAHGLQATIIRPAVVVGDSKTGETDKFDGPYLAFRLLDRLRFARLPLPRLGPADAEVNLVPIDYLVAATVALARRPDLAGQTFQIVDPSPLTAAELYDLACRAIVGRGAARFSVSPAIVGRVLDLRPVHAWLKVPSEILPYFNHRTRYDSSETLRALQGSGVAIPCIRDYLPTLVRFWEEHKDEPGFGVKA